MIKKRFSFFIFLIVTLTMISFGNVKAQDDILGEISYLYLNKLIAAAKENYPRIKNHNSQVTSAKNDLTSVRTSWFEPFSFAYAARSNNIQGNLVDVTTKDILTGYQFGITLNPGSLLSKPSQIKKAKEQVRIAEFSRDEYYLALEAEVKRRYFIYLQFKKSIVPANKVLLDAENNLNVTKLAYQKGEIKLTEYNEVSLAYNEAYMNKLEAETNFLTAKAALEELTVSKLEQIK